MKFLSHDGLLYFWKKTKSYVDTKYNELFQSVSNGKSLVASAITGKGIITDATATFATMASNINNIKTGVETYDATAVEDDVLSGKTYYKDNVKKTGTMIRQITFENNSPVTGYFNCHGDTYQEPNGNNTFMLPLKGYYDGSTWLGIAEPDLKSSNIKAGVTIGSPVGVTGTFTSDATATSSDILSGKTAYVNGAKITGTAKGETDVLNFPLSIQDTQPTAIRDGHIWVKSSTLASQITSVSIQEYLNASVPNNSLQFVVGETVGNYLHLINTSKRLTSGGNVIKAESLQNNGGIQDWRVTNVSNVIEYKLNKPMVYSKINGVVDIETAYMWNGSSWVILSEKGSYFTMGYYVYNLAGTTLTQNSFIAKNDMLLSSDGKFLFIDRNSNVYIRNGDAYVNYFTFPSTFSYNGLTYDRATSHPSKDGRRVVVRYSNYTSGSKTLLNLYVYNGSTYALQQTLPFDKTYNTFNVVGVNEDATIVAYEFNTSSGGTYYHNVTTYHTGQMAFPSSYSLTMSSGSITDIIGISSYGGYLYLFAQRSSSGTYYYGIYRSEIATGLTSFSPFGNYEKVSTTSHGYEYYGTSGVMAKFQDGVILTSKRVTGNNTASIVGIDLNTGTQHTVNFVVNGTTQQYYAIGTIALHLNEKMAVIRYGTGSTNSNVSGNNIAICNISRSGTTITLTVTNQIASSDDQFSLCPISY